MRRIKSKFEARSTKIETNSKIKNTNDQKVSDFDIRISDLAYHTPVLLNEVTSGLRVKPGKKYIDATLGGGGHALEILKRGGIVLGIDVDQEAIDYVKQRTENLEQRNKLHLVRGNFRDLGEIARENGFDKVAGIVFDLGVSSHQFEVGERGFSFQKDAPLDMRMDPSGSSGLATASDLVNGLYEHELTDIFKKYGEERRARTIAYAICRAREMKRIETTGELTKIIEEVVPRRGHLHPATRIFQALRIAVNDELNNLESALSQAIGLLGKDGLIAVISFHSLEDRIVKRAFVGHQTTKKPLIPTEDEVRINPRSRSGKLRIFENN